jgi:hypothetical protein
MAAPPSGKKLLHRFRQLDQRVDGKLLFANEFLPQSLETAGMARQPPDVAVRELALIEALFPLGNRGDGGGIGSPHRSKADVACVVHIPVGSHTKLGIGRGAAILLERPDREQVIHRQPDESGLREDRAIHSGHVALRRSKEHRAFLWQRPPGNHPLRPSDYTLGKKLRLHLASQGLDQRLHELDGQRLCWANRWLLCAIVCVHFMVGDERISETAILVFRRPVDQQGLTQREVMVLPDAHVDLHVPPPCRSAA